MIAFQTKKDQNGFNIPLYIDIDFVSENDLNVGKNKLMINSASTYKNIIQNLIKEEDDLYKKYNSMINKDDYLSQIVLVSERQGLLAKLLQQLSAPFIESLEIEIYNIYHYIIYLKSTNVLLRKLIDDYEKVTNN